MNAPFAATAVTPGWMAPPEYTPRHAARDPFPTAVDPALRTTLDALGVMFRTAHRVLLGGAR